MPTWAIVFELDNQILNNYWRKFYTYREIGWDEASIHEYLAKKEFTMQVASFNTPTVTFSASSRRNRFYDIYNRLDMLEQDVPWEGAMPSVHKIKDMYQIYVISARAEPLKEKTLEILERLGAPLSEMTIFFKKTNDQLSSFRKRCMQEIKAQYPTGIGVCLTPNDVDFYLDVGYTPVGFSSLKNAEEFNGKLHVICNSWPELLSSINCQ